MTVIEAPYLVMEGTESAQFRLTKNEMSVGRAPENDIRLDQVDVSRFHAQITQQGPVTLLSDLGSSNGTFVNGMQMRGTTELHEGDHVSFGSAQMVFHTPAPAAAPVTPAAGYGASSIQPPTDSRVAGAALEGEDGEPILLVKDETIIGRVPANDLVLPDTFVSRQHARIQRLGDQFVISDLGSANGTYVNGRRLSGALALQPGDDIRIGRMTFVFRELTQAPEVSSVAAFPVPQFAPATGRVTIQIENVQKVYRSGDSDVPVLRGVSLEIREGEFVSLVGPSGSGKSTLINMITGIDYPDSGSVVVNGQSLAALNENKLARWRGNTIGLIFQFFQLLPTLTALENVMLPMDFCSTYPSGQRKQRARECLALVGMEQFADRLPSNMSGGQQQRVAIARALANDPPIIIGDEPTGNLDSATAQQIFSLLGQLAQQGKTVAFVTHDPVLARSTPRKIEILDGEVVDTTARA